MGELGTCDECGNYASICDGCLDKILEERAGPSDNRGSEDSAALDVGEMKVKLIMADRVMQLIDKAVEENRMDSRSAIADARLNYGKPWTYFFLGGGS